MGRGGAVLPCGHPLAYIAERIALFGIVVGIALLLTGLGFAVLAAGGALRNREAPTPCFGRRVGAVPSA